MAAVIGVTERVTPAHVEFSYQKKKNTKSVSQSDSSKVARVRGVGFFFGEAADAPQTPATPVCFSAGQS